MNNKPSTGLQKITSHFGFYPKNRLTSKFMPKDDEPSDDWNNKISPTPKKKCKTQHQFGFKTPPSNEDSVVEVVHDPNTKKRGTKMGSEKDLSIDLTVDNEVDLLPGTPLQKMVEQNSLFFSYNPYGLDISETLPKGYCPSCRCPNNYCSNVVLGKMCYNHASFILYDVEGVGYYDEKEEAAYLFAKAYTEAVRYKMLQNNIDLHGDFEPELVISVPSCVKRGYQRKFIRGYIVAKSEYEEEENSFMNSNFDATEEEIRQAFGGGKK